CDSRRGMRQTTIERQGTTHKMPSARDLEPSSDWPYQLPRSGRDAITALGAAPPLDIFREYDIRGRIDLPPDPDSSKINGFLCDRLGRAFGTYLRQKGVDEVAIGYD